MASALLIDGDWYDRLGSAAYWEAEFERLVAAESKRLFPAFELVRFRASVQSDEGTAQADFALIDRDYRSWWVVEVELAHHSLSKHVLPQVTVLSRASYGDAEASYLAAAAPSLDPDRLRYMMRGLQPAVLVIVNASVPRWPDALRPLNASVVVIEVYRSVRNRHCLRVEGSLPEPPHAFLSRCYPDSIVPRLLTVESPGALPHQDDQPLAIMLDGSVTYWDRVEARDRVWLTPRRGNPLLYHRVYQLAKSADGQLVLAPDSWRRSDGRST